MQRHISGFLIPEPSKKSLTPEGKYIMKWVPEYDTVKYVRPIVEHTFARERVLKAYKKVLL
jgi:deoxyribodipyrimidine photo-lyase